MITVSNLVKVFGTKTVLQNLNLQVKSGEFVVLLGPNGAGKTTLLRILASLTRPTSGEINLNGYRLPQEARIARRSIGFISHLPLLYGDLTGEENLKFYGKLYGVADLMSRVEEALKTAGLYTRRHDQVRTYSRGMQQRLSIARAFLHSPQILLLDEPYTGLDQEACAILDQILAGNVSQRRTVIMTSHDLSRVVYLASRFDIIDHGMIMASIERSEIDPEQLLAYYQGILSKNH